MKQSNRTPNDLLLRTSSWSPVNCCSLDRDSFIGPVHEEAETVHRNMARSLTTCGVFRDGALTSDRGWQTIALGSIHTHRIVTVHVTAEVITIDLGGDDTRTVPRTTTKPIRRIKARQPRKAAHVS